MSPLSSKHLLEIEDFDHDDIELVLETAKSFAEINERSIKKLPTLRGRTIINLFLEPSTRTRTSFEIASKRLSADAVNMAGSSSSTVKGESLKDTAQTLSAMSCDLAIIRHKFSGAPRILAENMDCHVINGGDGIHQHPTQTLLDLFTIRERFGSIKGKTVGIVGDILHSRVAGSLAPALNSLGARVVFIAPPTMLPARPDILGGEVVYSLDDIVCELDIVYLLRIQAERASKIGVPSLREYSNLYCMDARRAKKLSKNALIMHPGPMNRGIEISSDLADDPRTAVLDQVTSGVAVRMAIMYLMLGGDSNGATA